MLKIEEPMTTRVRHGVTWIPILLAATLLLGAGRAHAGKASIRVSVAVPALGVTGERSIAYRGRTSHFAVVLTNTSAKPQRIVTPWSSWGDHALSFEITDAAGKRHAVHAVPVDYAKNMLSWWVLAPGETVVRDVYFADPKKWIGFPLPAGPGHSVTVTLRAVFEVASPAKRPKGERFWAGRVVSAPVKVVIHDWSGK